MLLHPHEIVERWGWTFPARPLPNGVRPMPPGECFTNAQSLVRRAARSRRPLAYCEGFVLFTPGDQQPCHHAWCVDQTGTVIDPTWPHWRQRAYTGVAFRAWILPHYERVHGPGFNLLGDPEIRSLTPHEFERIAYCRAAPQRTPPT